MYCLDEAHAPFALADYISRLQPRLIDVTPVLRRLVSLRHLAIVREASFQLLGHDSGANISNIDQV